MSSGSCVRPTFVGESWLLPSQGFCYVGDLPLVSLQLQEHENDWLQLVALVERAKRGDWSVCSGLLKLSKDSTCDDVRWRSLRIMGHTSIGSFRFSIRELFGHPALETREAAYEAAQYACDLTLIEPLLEAARSAAPEERLTIMSSISHLLEREPDALYDDRRELSHHEYERKVISAKRDCELRCGSGCAVFEGRPLSLGDVMQRAEDICGREDVYDFSGLVSMYFDMFEAMTGRSTRGVFDREVAVDTDEAVRVLSDFHRTGDLSRYEIGARYFFGRRLPS